MFSSGCPFCCFSVSFVDVYTVFSIIPLFPPPPLFHLTSPPAFPFRVNAAFSPQGSPAALLFRDRGSEEAVGS